MRRDHTFAVGGHVVIDVELPAGSVLLTAGESGTVAVSVDGSAPDVRHVAADRG